MIESLSPAAKTATKTTSPRPTISAADGDRGAAGVALAFSRASRPVASRRRARAASRRPPPAGAPRSARDSATPTKMSTAPPAMALIRLLGGPVAEQALHEQRQPARAPRAAATTAERRRRAAAPRPAPRRAGRHGRHAAWRARPGRGAASSVTPMPTDSADDDRPRRRARSPLRGMPSRPRRRARRAPARSRGRASSPRTEAMTPSTSASAATTKQHLPSRGADASAAARTRARAGRR